MTEAGIEDGRLRRSVSKSGKVNSPYLLMSNYLQRYPYGSALLLHCVIFLQVLSNDMASTNERNYRSCQSLL
jgi:hypothetical protein